jgi:hypothetical protein
MSNLFDKIISEILLEGNGYNRAARGAGGGNRSKQKRYGVKKFTPPAPETPTAPVQEIIDYSKNLYTLNFIESLKDTDGNVIITKFKEICSGVQAKPETPGFDFGIFGKGLNF